MAATSRYDPSDISVRVGTVEITNLQELDFDPGITLSAVDSPSGFCGHETKHSHATLKLKFKAQPHSEMLASLGQYAQNLSEVAVTIVTPEFAASIIQARLSSHPKRSASIESMAEYEVEITGKTEGLRYG